jgi:hypothetical protein
MAPERGAITSLQSKSDKALVDYGFGHDQSSSV